MRAIPLSQDKVTFVDDDDYEFLAQRKWYALRRPRLRNEDNWHAVREEAKGKFLYMHRVILNAPDGAEVDHVDGDGLNNQRSNLRLANRGENASNLQKQNDTSSQYKGVVRFRGKWQAYIHVCDKKFHLGTFVIEEEAAKAYDAAAKAWFGEYANTNF
jgi:hypothetical protein